MENPFYKFGRWLFNKNPKSPKVYRDINEERIEKDKEYKKLARGKATLEGQLARERAEKIQKKEEVKKEEVENEIAKNLTEQTIDLKKQEYGEFFSFRNIYKAIYSGGKLSKFGKKFEIADKNDKVSWKFGDIGIFPNIKSLGIIDREGNIRVISPYLSGVIHKPETIHNQIKRGRILIATDENGDYIKGIDDESDLDDYEVPVPVWMEEKGDYEITTDYKKKARDIIIELQDDNRDFREKNKRLEISLNLLRIDNDNLKRTNEVLLHAGQTQKTSISQAIGLTTSLSLEMTDINTKITTLTERNVHLEREVEAHKSAEKKLLALIEEMENPTALAKATAMMREAREFERANPPQEKEEAKPVKISQPGEVVGQGGKL